MTYIRKRLDSLSSKYYFILMSDLSADLSNNFVDSFCGSYSLKSFIRKPTCFKNPDHTTCIDLILTNRQKSFYKFYHYGNKVIWLPQAYCYCIKKLLQETEAQGAYLDFKNFSNQQFRTELVKELNENNVVASQFKLFQTMSLGLCISRHLQKRKLYGIISLPL